MALCFALMVILSFVLKVESLPTISSVITTQPASNHTNGLLHDSPHNHGPDHNPHHHHNDNNNNVPNSHVNKTLTSLGHLIHHMLDKDESHLKPVVQTFADCITGCMNPKHPPPHAEMNDNNHGGDRHHAVVVKDSLNTEENDDDDFDDEDSEDILNRLREVLRDNSHAHLNPADKHPNAAGSHPEDSMNYYWMCHQGCLTTFSSHVIG